MAKEMLPFPNYQKNTLIPSLKCSRSRYPVVQRLHRTAFAFSWRLYPRLHYLCAGLPSLLHSPRKMGWSVKNSVDGGRSDSGTRLIRVIRAFRIKLSTKIKETKKGFPIKVLFFLLGFYCATAFATVIGQTGDWDILSAGLAVVVVEGIGALMYRAASPLLDRLRNLITMFNYWKAGLSLGLFLDAFKYEIDMILGLFDPLNFEIDMFPTFCISGTSPLLEDSKEEKYT